MCSARATLASFPDCMIIPLIKSETLTLVPSLINILDPGVCHALTEILGSSSKLINSSSR